MTDQSQNQPWIVVGKPKRKQIKKQQKLVNQKRIKIIYETGKPLYIINNHETDIQQFMSSPSYKINSQLITKKLQQRKKNIKNQQICIQIQCLGLGDFIRYAKPRYQYLFLIKLLIPLCKQYISNNIVVNCYDPIFTQQCKKQIQHFATCKPDHIPQTQSNKIIILYMPHCQRFLYERYCERYDKKQIFVIGNSIQQYVNRCQLLSEEVPACFRKRKFQQCKLKDFRESFNDTFCYFI